MDAFDELFEVRGQGFETAAEGLLDLPVHRVEDHEGDVGVRVVGATVNNPTARPLHVEIILSKSAWTMRGQALAGEEVTHLGVPSTKFKLDIAPGDSGAIKR